MGLSEMELDVVLFWLEIFVLINACLLIIFSFFKESSSQEALSSISGGSQKLFLSQKTKLSSSLLWLVLLFLTLSLFSAIISLRIIINVLA